MDHSCPQRRLNRRLRCLAPRLKRCDSSPATIDAARALTSFRPSNSMLRLIPVLVAFYACTTTLPPGPSPTRRAITIISIPPGAVIVVDHDTVGPAPLTAHPNRRRIAGTLDELLIQ